MESPKASNPMVRPVKASRKGLDRHYDVRCIVGTAKSSPKAVCGVNRVTQDNETDG